MAKKTDEKQNNGSKLLTILVSLLIVFVWLAIFSLLVKLDIGGFGSGVLRPILKDVPVINGILPNVSEDQLAFENDYPYNSLSAAIARIKELEQQLEEITEADQDYNESMSDLFAEVERLRFFEENQLAFEERLLEFEQNVVYAEAAPNIEEYKKYYEAMNPANAEIIYRQVIEQLQYSDAIREKADIYRRMDPKDAASILQTMSADISSVAKILLSMKSKESAEILANMDPIVAAKITKKMLDMDAERLAAE